MASRPPTLMIRGPFRGYSGYEITTRSLARALSEQGVLIGLIDIPNWSQLKLPDHLRDPNLEALVRSVDADIVLHICPPSLVMLSTDHMTANLSMFEATKVPEVWISNSRYHDLVVVPTASSRAAWVNTGFPASRIRLCPLGVDTKRFHPGLEPLALTDREGRPLTDFRTRVLNVSTLDRRKNLLGLIKVWLSSTSHDDDAILIVKLSPTEPLRLIRFLRDVKLLEGEIGKPRELAAPILFLDTPMPDEDIPRLYACATHYWSMSFGEGWDQPMTEAGASGLQLIAPDHSAYQGYLSSDVAWMIPSSVVHADYPSDSSHQILFAGADWWEPDPTAAGTLIRAAVDGQLPQLDARSRLEGFSWDASARRLREALSELDPGLSPQ